MKKMAKVYVVLAAIATLAFGLFSCSGGGNDVNPLALYSPLTPLTPLNSPTLKYLDLSNAKSLYISGGSGTSANISASANGSSAKKIFKITDTGHVEEVKYLDENKKEISITNQPVAIHSVNIDYFFVGFGQWSTSIGTGYLVRKSDGAVFDMKNAGMPTNYFTAWKNAPVFYTDEQNRMYYISSSKIISIDLSGVDSLAGTVTSPSTDTVWYFEVDKNGNIIYSGCSASDDSNRLTRIRKNNGGLKNISNTENTLYWIGFDGNIYYQESSLIKKILIDAEYNVSENNYGTISNTFTRWLSYKIKVKNNVILIPQNNDKIYEVYNSSATPRDITFAGLTLKTVTAANSTENFYYIAGTDSSNNTILIKVNPEDDSWTNLLPDNNYEVYTFTASETDGITFNALRMSDGKKIIGKVGINGGEVSVIDEESDAQISYLERIN